MTTRVRSREETTLSWSTTYGTSPGATNVRSGTLTRYEEIQDEHNTEATAYHRLLRNADRRGSAHRRARRTIEWMRKTRDLGGPMYLRRRELFASSSGAGLLREYPLATPPYKRYLVGHVFPITPPANDSFMESTDVGTLLDRGAEAIAQVRPTQPYSSLGIALGELWKDGLPSVPGLLSFRNRGQEVLRTAGGEYLNLVFGLQPMLKDLADVYNAMTKSEELWHDYVVNAERPLHRKFGFKPVKTTTTTTDGSSYGYPVGASQLYAGPGTRRKTVETETRQWFEGVFRYYLPEDRTAFGKSKMMLSKWRKLYGLDVDPGVLWNLIPWSWLIDWFLDIGPMFEALSDLMSDGLVMQYGYLMEHKIETTTWTLHGLTSWDSRTPIAPVLTHRRETKRRIRATPFGFGLNEADFTPRQWAILAALGFARHP